MIGDSLIKTTFVSAAGTMSKFLALVGINKIFSIYLGPAGFFLVGQFQNLMQVFSAASPLTVQAGIIKYTTDFSNEENSSKLIRLWKTVSFYSVVISIFLVFISIIFGSNISTLFFESTKYYPFIILFSFLFVFFCFNNLLLSILNGKKEVLTLTYANIVGSIISITLIFFLVESLGSIGALYALVSYQAVAFLGTLLLCCKKEWFSIKIFFGTFDKESTMLLSKFFAMSFVTACCVPIMQLIIRSNISSEFSIEYAGYWEAITRISAVNLMFASSVLTVYFLPRFSEIDNRQLLFEELKQAYLFISPLLLLGLSLIYLYKESIVLLLFSKDFLIISDLLFWQLVGDFLRINSFILSYIFLSKAITKIYIISEIVFTCIFVVLALIFLKLVSFESVFLSYAAGYLLYFFFLTYVMFIRKNNISVSYFS